MAPPLVSHGFGGDGEDIFPRVPPHRTVARIYGAVAIAVAVMVDGNIFDVRFGRSQRGWRVTEVDRSEFAGFAGIRSRSMGGSASTMQALQALHKQSRDIQGWKGALW